MEKNFFLRKAKNYSNKFMNIGHLILYSMDPAMRMCN